ncbi:bifunctional lysylphosphatidylglycerol synthetase/lysine--tRNA ligase LysX [Kribbia dieselivorans]|uniref:bifunctional lysylphosphatidylglycerol synthetase/lysine--tRNA ligase LysX n=1 Tax=Kribbia dieselivorans TaxID=331526 RepID=UPI000838C4DB|nr:bifunctional lysylphosphatidylglycerol synthetase/lysine--tRNA ligase LysX [Kribbia dieselivorans]
MTASRPRTARALSTIYAVATAVALILTLLSSGLHGTTWAERAFGLLNVPVAQSLLSVVVLALTSRALIARKRVGLVLVAAFQVIGIVLGLAALLPRGSTGWFEVWQSRTGFGRALDVAAVVTGLFALWMLWRVRGEFRGRLRIRRAGPALMILVVGSLATVAVTMALMEIARTEGPTVEDVARAVLAALGGETMSEHLGIPGWLIHVTAAMAALTILAAAIVLLGPTRPTRTWTQDREIAIRALLQRYGAADSLGYLATRRDKNAVFAPDGRAAVTYRVVAGVSIASADPIGEPTSWDAAVRAWLTDARVHGWVPAVISASEAGAQAYAAAGLRVGRMGDEAVLTPSTWDLGKASMQPVVRAIRHARRSGLVVSFARQEELSPDELTEVTRSADAWRGTEPDRGFSMALNRAGDAADGRILHVLTRDTHGTLMGLLSFVPWGHSAVSLDVMRRNPDAPNGVTELMIGDLMTHARTLGVQRVSLNFCMFRDTFEAAGQVGAGSFVNGLAVVLGQLDRFWQLERLYEFNRRFDPAWVTRFYAYDDPASLPQAAWAAGVAEGFLPSLTAPVSSGELDAPHVAQARALDDLPALDSVVTRAATQQERERRRRWQAMGQAGLDPNPVGGGEPADTLADLARVWAAGRSVEVVARVRWIRDHGGVVFVTLTDAGVEVQALLESGSGAQPLDRVRRFVDSGDLVRVAGVLGESRNGTPSIIVTGWRMEAKALRPVPFTGLESAQARLRDRSADLLVHPDQAALLRQRSAVVAAVRQVLLEDGYLEVDTPVLQAVHGGATARPFQTWSNAYGLELSLRIAPELYLKRLLVGGLGPVFEMGRNFRNEGADATHNPEFTALEAYHPNADYMAMAAVTERLVKAAAQAVHGAPVLPLPTAAQARVGLVGVELRDVSAPWPVVRVLDAVGEALGAAVTIDMAPAELRGLAAASGVRLHPRWGTGEMIEELYSELVEPATTYPTFFVDFPQATSPLTRPHRSVPGLVERWDLVAAGMEVATAYSELTDPVDQRARLMEQSHKAAAGDPEAMEVDEDFLRALELGMPPSGGLGMGIDRLVMLVTNTPIRSVLAFPFVRPTGQETSVSDPFETS